jgi:hypothetical protein
VAGYVFFRSHDQRCRYQAFSLRLQREDDDAAHMPAVLRQTNQIGGSMTRILSGSFVIAAILLGSVQITRAEDTVMFPDAKGNMVRISIAHTYEQCRKNGRHLGYSDSDSHAWCSQHCNGKICQ